MPLRTLPVPLALRARRAARRFPPKRAYSVIRQIIVHPSNRGRRGRALRHAARWQIRSRISTRPLELAVWEGMTLRAYPRSNSASNIIYFTERFDPAEMAIMEAVVRPGDLAIDAGANIGAYTLRLAQLVGSAGSVVAIEPAQQAAERLRENVDLNRLDHVTVVAAAIGARRGEASMTTDGDVSNTLTVSPGTTDVTSVPVVTLDSLAERPPSFVKLDVEGYEHEALKGAGEMLTHRPVLQIELTEHLLARMGTSSAEIRSQLQNAGYRTGYPRIVGGCVVVSDTPPDGNHNLVGIAAEQWDDVIARL